MRKFLMVAALVAVSGPALAWQNDAPAQDKQAKKQFDPNKVVCRSEAETGSRLASHRTCLTVTQWEQQQRDTRQTVDHAQIFREEGGG